jgi:broad specificity phosphatase PhoE
VRWRNLTHAVARGFLAAVLIGTFGCATASAQRTIILVRHAEKATDANEATVPLSAAGHERAERLARMLAGAGVTAIYATETDRAKQTAEPLARALKLDVRTYSPRDSAGALAPQIVLERIRKDDASGVVLVVGHQNTVPAILEALGHTEKVEIADKQFDDLFVVVPKKDGAPTVVRLKY